MAADRGNGISLEEAEDALLRSLRSSLSTSPGLVRYVANSVRNKLDEILAALDDVEVTDGDENLAENSTVVPFTSSRPGGSALRAVDPERGFEARYGRLFPGEAHAKCLYTANRGIAPWVAEFVILRTLQLAPTRRWQKRALYEYLSRKFEIGTFASFATRLHNMRQEGAVAWADRQHGAPLELTPTGVDRCDELMMHRQSRVSDAQYDCLLTYVDELQLKPRVR